jgi:hypothetical protein
MTQSELGASRPSVLLVDESGCLPGHHNAWLERDLHWQARRAETLVEAVECLRFEPATSVLFAPSEQDSRDCARTLRTIRLLQPEIIVGIVLNGPPSEEKRWLDAGADFVTGLPFCLEQAAARLRAVLCLQRTAFQRGLERRESALNTPPPEPLIALGEDYRFNRAVALTDNPSASLRGH